MKNKDFGIYCPACMRKGRKTALVEDRRDIGLAFMTIKCPHKECVAPIYVTVCPGGRVSAHITKKRIVPVSTR